ncbi:hypothetical protein NDU88_002389 [Pleurodeles waltl]|uniref:Uncharacterized protein n=1 Tax=Pleurodeles waltl TaxID=8319 RepID=A0AAV7SA80_PLEWA|nr:hypothetical protein NDU88_002389 [Pleurodeles waltl]
MVAPYVVSTMLLGGVSGCSSAGGALWWRKASEKRSCRDGLPGYLLAVLPPGIASSPVSVGIGRALIHGAADVGGQTGDAKEEEGGGRWVVSRVVDPGRDQKASTGALVTKGQRAKVRDTGSRIRRDDILASLHGSLRATRDHGSHSATKDVSVHRATRDYRDLHGTRDDQDSMSLDMFVDNDRSYDEFVFDIGEDPDIMGGLDDDLQGYLLY